MPYPKQRKEVPPYYLHEGAKVSRFPGATLDPPSNLTISLILPFQSMMLTSLGPSTFQRNPLLSPSCSPCRSSLDFPHKAPPCLLPCIAATRPPNTPARKSSWSRNQLPTLQAECPPSLPKSNPSPPLPPPPPPPINPHLTAPSLETHFL
jgi:hypothetical protein